MSTVLPRLIHSSPTFAGHQTFTLRAGWLKKGLDALQDEECGGGELFARPDALITLGVGKNMVESIRHWLLVTGMAQEEDGARRRRLQPTALGRAVLGSPGISVGWDPFIEDVATLWLLHWELAKPQNIAATWVWTFSAFHEYEFTKISLAEMIRHSLATVAKLPSIETVNRDVECLLHTYVPSYNKTAMDDDVDCPLHQLRLIDACSLERNAALRRYRFQIGPKPSLPRQVFYYALVHYWQWKASSSPSISLWELTHGEGSPGAVFKLDEDSVLAYLDAIEADTHGTFRLEDTAQRRQLSLIADALPASIEFLREYYDHITR